MRMILALAIFAFGCATPYQPRGFRGGYEDAALGSKRHLVRVHVNRHTSMEQAFGHWRRRADEICGPTFWRGEPTIGDAATVYALQPGMVVPVTTGQIVTGTIVCDSE